MDRRVAEMCERIGGFGLMRGVWFGALLLLVPGLGFGQQQSVPEAPAPQAQSAPPNAPAPQTQPLSDLKNQVAPGKGAGVPADETSAGQTAPHIDNGTVQAPAAQQAPPPDDLQKAPPEPLPPPGPGQPYTFHIPVTAVDVPVTVRDKHGNFVGGLPWWRFRVYEDGVRQRIAFFSADAYPLSIAFVIDATLPNDIMQKVNRSFGAVTGALTPADTVAVISYAGTSPQLITGFTGAEGQRLPAALELAKKPGQPMGVPLVDGPFALGPMVNGQSVDPTLEPQHGNAGNFVVPPKEAHPLNDAILYAAEQLAGQPRGRRRIIYVVSDGRNIRSKASYKEVLQYLLTNNISVYGTEVGDSALWGIGYLDRVKLPLMQPDDLLPRYVLATGGEVEHQISENGIQNAFVHITQSVRTAYTLVYMSHQSTISDKYHTIDVRIEGIPNLTVDAKAGYYPSAAATF